LSRLQLQAGGCAVTAVTQHAHHNGKCIRLQDDLLLAAAAAADKRRLDVSCLLATMQKDRMPR
jgi:hypothetical protein